MESDSDPSEEGWASPRSHCGLRTPVRDSSPSAGYQSVVGEPLSPLSVGGTHLPADVQPASQAAEDEHGDAGWESPPEVQQSSPLPRRGRPRRPVLVSESDDNQLATVQDLPDFTAWSRGDARHVLIEGALSLPEASRPHFGLALSALAVSSPQDFSDSSSGKALSHIFERHLEQHRPSRGSTWAQEVAAAGMDGDVRSSQLVYMNRFFELAELIYMSSRLFFAGLIRRTLHSIDDGTLEGIMLITISQSDEASSKLRVPYMRQVLTAIAPDGAASRSSALPGIEQSTETAKVVQTEMIVGMLVRHVATNSYRIIYSSLPCTLRAMDRGTTETLHQVHRLFPTTPT